MQEQGKTAAWYGRLLLFTAVPAGLVTLRTSRHPVISGPPRPTLPA